MKQVDWVLLVKMKTEKRYGEAGLPNALDFRRQYDE
jgi:hypothetical protein